ncbi:MAG: hypothetical protein NTZ17_14160 [Phycisphaerae bacterium]|nr:hypothetical protein [Phycisphaerae bacterium]
MIDITRDNNVDENGPQTPSAISGDGEGLDASQEDPSPWEPFSDPEDSVLGAPPESEPYPRDPLEWYLMKLLAPVEDAPRERVPQPAGEAPWDEMPAPEELDAPAPQEPPEAAEKPKETRPLWQTMEADVLEAPVAAVEASPAAQPAPADAQETPAPRKRQLLKPKKRATIRSLTKRERTGGGRQKLMTVLIPVLAIAMVIVLKHPLGARSTVKAAGEAPTQTASPVSTDVQIAWEIPSPYDLAGRDPMKGTTPTVVALESDGTAAAAAEPLVELVVTGILYSPDNPAAIVDTQVVHEGQQISGATVEKIEKDGIQFERKGRRWKQTVTQK